jgi:hypothetical protein
VPIAQVGFLKRYDSLAHHLRMLRFSVNRHGRASTRPSRSYGTALPRDRDMPRHVGVLVYLI